MPIRTSSLTPQIQKNGARLHLAMAQRVHSHGADVTPSDDEKALLEERRLLKQDRATRKAQALLPKPVAAKVVKAPKAPKRPKAPKAPKAEKEPKDAKDSKGNKPSRAEKLTKKAENLETAKKAERKSAKT